MITAAKNWIKARWPALRLRSILLGVLLFTALMPALSAVFLRVYENVLVRQTEAELIAQAAALSAAFAQAWPDGAPTAAAPRPGEERPYSLQPLTIDLNTMAILPERPPSVVTLSPPDPKAAAAAATVAPIVEATTLTTLASVRILDRAGIVVFGRDDIDRSYAGLPEVAAALAGTPETVLRRRGNYQQRYTFEALSRAAAIRVHYAYPIRVRDKVVGVMLLSRSPRALFRGIYDDRNKILLGFGLVFVAIIGIAGVLSRTITRPIEQLTRATEHIGAGGIEVPATPATATIEIRALFENFRLMAGQIDRRSRYLRDFASAVSHEFKTPLAGIKGALELLEDHGGSMSEEDRRRFLANANADAERLSHLVGRLLALARADMAAVAASTPTDLAPPLHRVADAMRTADLAIDLDLEDPLPPVAVPADIIEAVVTTLIENSRQAGAHRVRISALVAPDAVTLLVADDGGGIAPGDRARLFEPFFTTRRAQGGTGLGLPIARSLLAASRSTIDYVEAGRGSCFRLNLRRVG